MGPLSAFHGEQEREGEVYGEDEERWQGNYTGPAGPLCISKALVLLNTPFLAFSKEAYRLPLAVERQSLPYPTHTVHLRNNVDN